MEGKISMQKGVPSILKWLPFILLLLFEAVVFFIQASLHVSPFFAPGFDQVGSFNRIYELASIFRAQGMGAALESVPSTGSASTALLYPQAALLSLFIGSPRIGALTVNLLYFLILQSVVFWLVLERRNDVRHAWVAIASLLTLGTLFFSYGGIFDLRPDFVAMCLFGIWVCVVLRSRTFLDFKWSLIAGAVAAWLILNRHITVVYYGSVMGVFLLLLLVRAVLTRAPDPTVQIRARHVVLSGLLTLVLTSPVLLSKLAALYEYYFVAMFVSGDKDLWAKAFVQSEELSSHLKFYPRSIYHDHVGQAWFAILGLAVGVCVIVLSVRRNVGPQNGHRLLRSFGYDHLFLATVILVPLFALNLSVNKSPVIGGILSVPIVLLGLSLLAAMIDVARTAPLRQAPWIPERALAPIAAAAIVAFGISSFAYRAAGSRSILAAYSMIELAEINRFHRDIARYVVERGNDTAVVFSDRLDEILSYFPLVAYEQYDRFIRYGYAGITLVAPSKEELFVRLPSFDIVLLSSPGRRQHTFPSDATIESYWPELAAWVRANRILVSQMNVAGVPYAAYARPLVKITGASGGWITRDGIVLEVSADALARWPRIILSGPVADVIKDGFAASASLLSGDGEAVRSLAVTTTMDLKMRRYDIVVDGSNIGTGPTVKVALTFNQFFVPKELGINSDTRQLVVQMPTSRELLPANSP